MSSCALRLCTSLPHETLECSSRISGRKPWLQYPRARCRQTRTRSPSLYQTTCCRECSILSSGPELRCQCYAKHRGRVESSTYPVLVLLLETRRRCESCPGLSSREAHSLWEQAPCPQEAPSELGSSERLPAGVCRSFPWSR